MYNQVTRLAYTHTHTSLHHDWTTLIRMDAQCTHTNMCTLSPLHQRHTYTHYNIITPPVHSIHTHPYTLHTCNCYSIASVHADHLKEAEEKMPSLSANEAKKVFTRLREVRTMMVVCCMIHPTIHVFTFLLLDS